MDRSFKAKVVECGHVVVIVLQISGGTIYDAVFLSNGLVCSFVSGSTVVSAMHGLRPIGGRDPCVLWFF